MYKQHVTKEKETYHVYYTYRQYIEHHTINAYSIYYETHAVYIQYAIKI